VKHGLILEQEAEKRTYLNELNVRKPLVVSTSQKREKLRLQLGFEFDNLEPRLKSGIFKCISWLNANSSHSRFTVFTHLK
jgi:hypothetical protein